MTVGCVNYVGAKIWDSRRKLSFQTLQNMYQVTSVCFSDTAEQVISGGIDNDIKVPAWPECTQRAYTSEKCDRRNCCVQ